MATTVAAIKFDRAWAMPSAHTFKIPPIEKLVKEEMGIDAGLWADPFAGFNSPATATNDLNPETPAIDHIDALEWLRRCETNFFDGVLLDPPYSLSQAAEVYAGFGAEKLNHHPSNMGYWADVKDEIARIVRPGGKVICCGWSSNGLGEGRGFQMTRILLVPHGGSKNDTIITAEQKIQGRLFDPGNNGTTVTPSPSSQEGGAEGLVAGHPSNPAEIVEAPSGFPSEPPKEKTRS